MKDFFSTTKQGLRAQEEGKFSLAYNLLGRLLQSATLSTKATIKLEIRRCECLLGTGNFAACQETLDSLEARFGDVAGCNMELGHFYFRLEDFTRALSFYKRACELAPNDLRIYDCMSRLYIDINKYPDAIATLQKALEVEVPKQSLITTAYVHVQLALCYFYTEEPEAAREHFAAAEAIDDTKIYDWDIYGRLLLKLADYEKAVECFDRSLLEICADDYEVYLHKAKALIALGRMPEAEQLIKLAKQELGELLIFPADLKFYAPLIANGFMSEMGAILVEE